MKTAPLFTLILGALFAPDEVRGATLESGAYQTTPGAMVEERGDRVPGGARLVPLSATLTFDLEGSQPSLTAVIENAVLEGGPAFALTVRSSSGWQPAAGTYRFSGDYLRELEPPVSGYGFDWTFSTADDGGLVWNGSAGWMGGHLWLVTMSDVPIAPFVVPEPATLTLLGAGLGLLAVGRPRRRTAPT